jgi:hypothetical protein
MSVVTHTYIQRHAERAGHGGPRRTGHGGQADTYCMLMYTMEYRGLCPLPGLCHSLRLLLYGKGGGIRMGDRRNINS